jgi:hypothetical protein
MISINDVSPANQTGGPKFYEVSVDDIVLAKFEQYPDRGPVALMQAATEALAQAEARWVQFFKAFAVRYDDDSACPIFRRDNM